jgi:uncharacterized paraquat-inducible protein A
MKFLLTAPLLAVALLLTTAGTHSLGVVTAAQKQRSAHPKKPAEFHFVCPMHETVTSKKRGTCPKCKMKLVKKQVKQPSTGSN